MIDAGEIFHPLRWSPQEASRFLASVPELESAGVVVRMPATWRASRPPRPQVTATVGARAPSKLGLEGVLDFRMDVTLDGERLTERRRSPPCSPALTAWCCCAVSGSRSIATGSSAPCGNFVEAEELAAKDGLTFAEAMRMLAGAAVVSNDR